MAAWLLRRIIGPLLAVAFFIGLGGFFAFVGLQSTRLRLTRLEGGRVDALVTRSRLLGLLSATTALTGVRTVEYRTSRSAHSAGRLGTLGSAVVLVADSGEARLTDTSNAQPDRQRRIRREVGQYLASRAPEPFEHEYSLNNVMAWIGVPILLLGLYGLVALPFSWVSLGRPAR